MSPKHKRRIIVEVPAWVADEEFCVSAVAEDAYTAKSFAEEAGAPHNDSCAQLMRAGEKSLRILENRKASARVRCSEGDRAARKFWEAKVCARRVAK